MPPEDKRLLIFSGSSFEETFAYSRAVVQGDWCFVAGTTGLDYVTREMPKSAEDQARNALGTISRTLDKAGFRIADVVRVTYILTDAEFRHEVAPALCEVFDAVRPAATMFVAGLNEPNMKIEIEVTAYRGAASPA
jgi:enamine deaminase RidA (YjgF/YER057c/UK114 family)